MNFLGIDMGGGVMSGIVTPGIAVVSVSISSGITVVMVSIASVMIISAVGGTVVSVTNVPCFVVSVMIRITVVLSKFNVSGLMLGLVMVSRVEAVSVAVVAIVSMGAIAVAVAIDAVVTFSSNGGTVISVNTVCTMAMVSRSTVVSMDTISRSAIISMGTISVSSNSVRVVAVVGKLMLIRTGGDLSNTTTELMVIDRPMVSHNVLNDLLRWQDITLHVGELHILVVGGIGSLLVVLAFRLTVG